MPARLQPPDAAHPLHPPLHPRHLPPPTDIQHAEAQLQCALRELGLLRREEERALGERSGRLHAAHAADMQALERRFLADAEALQVRR